MSTDRGRVRCRERLERLAGSALDCDSLRREAIADLQRVIGFDRWCWPLSDPETLLPSSGIAEHDFGPGVPRSLELEYGGDRFATKHDVARRACPSGSLSLDTHGDLACSARWDQVLRPVGIGDVALAACRDALGCWGWVEAYRDQSDQPFEDEDIELLEHVGSHIGSALRRGAMGARDGAAGDSGAPGVMVLDRDLKAVSWTPEARAWIDALPSAGLFAQWGMLPSVIYPAATRARSHADSTQARALVQAVDGRWVMVEAAPLDGERDGETAISLRSATPAETYRLLCRTYALSRRERDVVALVVRGLDTRAVGESLFISPHTVQDHLKSVFEKVGIHSRGELLATLGASAA